MKALMLLTVVTTIMSLLTQERGLKDGRRINYRWRRLPVAPHAGAWIESLPEELVEKRALSLLTQERGLKVLCLTNQYWTVLRRSSRRSVD